MPVDEVITELEQAVLAAARQAKEASTEGSIANATSWASAAHTLSQALSLVRNAYNP